MHSDRTQIRHLEDDDASALLEYFRELVTADRERVERPEDVARLTVADEQKWIRARARDLSTSDLIARCAVDEGRIVAIGELQRMQRWIERHVAEIRFGALPGNAAAATLLVEELLEIAARANIRVLLFFHLETQHLGLTVMSACGFREVGRIPGYYCRGDVLTDRVYLVKQLSG